MKRLIMLFLCTLLTVVIFVSAQDDHLATMDSFSAYLDQIASAPAEEADAMVDVLWNNYLIPTQSIPFVRGGDIAFLYRGDAEKVEWRGDFTNWQSDARFVGERVGETDLWVVYFQFPTTARLDYKIVLNGGTWILDPNNPYQQMGGFGANSELRMGDYVPSPFIVRDETTPKGNLRGVYTLQSDALGYAVNYSVYVPVGYAELDELPTIYVLDGHEYADDDMGSMVIVLDNLIAQNLISPVIAIFIDPRNVDNVNNNLRQDQYLENPAFAQFVAQELVVQIDRVFKTSQNASDRAILGTSLGGLASAYMGVNYPDVFNKIAIQSPAFWAGSDLYELYENSEGLALSFIITNGLPLWDSIDVPRFTAILDEKDYPYTTIEIPEGHSWGNWRALVDDILMHFWSLES
ncbi:MAG: alpha/beta hydrolase-fold protein [Anaerolineae bacterium]|nr:alpha/beta hydrolase-fold protein [Anaerolineae bacterium]